MKVGTNKVNGIPILGGEMMLAQGSAFFLDPTNGSDSNTGATIEKAKATLETGAGAYQLLTDNYNDVLYYLGGSSSISLASALVWSKSYCHLIGAGVAPTRVAQRTRIFHSFNAATIITFSGTGNLYKNFYFSHGRGSATNKIGVTITGGRSVYENVHFAGPQNDTEAGEATYAVIDITGDENTFKKCVFGNNSIARSAACTSMDFSGGAARTHLEDCTFIAQSDSADATHIRVDAVGIDRYLLIQGETVMDNGGTAMTQAIDSDITAPNARKIIITGNLLVIGATDVADATGDGTIEMHQFTATANVLGLSINPAVT